MTDNPIQGKGVCKTIVSHRRGAAENRRSLKQTVTEQP
jgi:hypothetical protein